MLLDYGSWPNSAHDLVLRNENPVSLDQDAQHFECTRPQRDGLPSASRVLPQQAATSPEKSEAVEFESLRQCERIDGGNSLLWSEQPDCLWLRCA
jgi:hypothetical protein